MASSLSLGTASLKPSSARKLSQPTQEIRRLSMDLPERFRVDDDDEEDGGRPDEKHPETFVQQSMYGIIAAQSRRNLAATLRPVGGSESESEGEGSKRNSKDVSRTVSEDSSARSSFDDKPNRLA